MAAESRPSGPRCLLPIRRALRAVADCCLVGKETAAAAFQLALPVRGPPPVPEAMPEAMPYLQGVPDRRRRA